MLNQGRWKAESMSRSYNQPAIQSVSVSDDTLMVELTDERGVFVPLAWFPRLLAGTQAERDMWRLIGTGSGIHWDELDEDISVAGLLAGRASGESQRSLQNWLTHRAAASPQP